MSSSRYCDNGLLVKSDHLLLENDKTRVLNH